MTPMEELAGWVQKKPIVLMRFDEEYSGALFESREGFEYFTIVRPHAVFQDCTLPTLCILEIWEEGKTACYLASATRKAAVSTFDSRLTIKKLRRIAVDSISAIEDMLQQNRMKRLLATRQPVANGAVPLSPKLSRSIYEALRADPENQDAIETAVTQLPKLRKTSNNNWAQEDAISTAMEAFGIRHSAVPEKVALKEGASSGLGWIGAYLYEDNVVHADASSLPGFDTIGPAVTGRAVFARGDEQLVIYTANKLPLERMFGVDLIYINDRCGNIVMVQYKMLEKVSGSDGKDWCFRPDQQLRNEIARMSIPAVRKSPKDYRLCRKPFFFKFVKREVTADSTQSFIVSLDHLDKILAAPASRGPKGGTRISFNALDGTYLRHRDMIGLIRSGYVGTHGTETTALKPIIDAAAKGHRGVVLAWQKKRTEMTP